MRNRIEAMLIDTLDAGSNAAASLRLWKMSERFGRAADRIAGRFPSGRRFTFLGFRVRELVALVALVVTVAIGALPYMGTSCDVVEHGPTGPEMHVTVGRTVVECDDGTATIEEWDMSDGHVFGIHFRDASGTWTTWEDGR